MSSSQRDFSLFSLFTAGLACLVPFANAYTKPVGAEPKGNPIYQPGLNSIVPVGEGFTVTWGPTNTTADTVTLVLLKGPSANAVPQYALVEKIPNNGSWVWTPSTDLAPGDTGYGIQLIDDATGEYQYSTQFGISNPNYKPSTSSSASSTASASASKSSSATEYASTTKSSSSTKSATGIATVSETVTANGTATASIHYTTEVVSKFTTYCPSATSLTLGNHTYTISTATTLTVTDCPCTITKPVTTATAGPITTSAVVVASTGHLPVNSSMVYPTGSMTIPSSLMASASATSGAANATGSSTAPIQTGAASGMATSFVGLVVAAGVAVFAL
ncbi:hypothetical protein B0A55_04999 [Friedmanniomyces simplex]|uniref:Yeast cell wall synthesis Kre9/Knh1-like N-terminal domain-containing protein n=1 Tax=Friedmanniomyces simplex TaxID=329884 RepID=A0A4U0XHU3_9PEZI|nr:hypothetical protein B0A55_04999 [Friedmanniomyces simplex]